MKKNILITGISGLIGHGLIDLLRWRNDYNAIGIYHRNKPCIEAENIFFIKADLTEAGILRKIDHVPIDAIIHCAAMIPSTLAGKDARKARVTNLQMDKLIISYAVRNNAKLIYMSGTSVYGMDINKVCAENSDLNPPGEYLKGKVEAERIILNKKGILKNFIFRISAPYGPYQKSNTVMKIFIYNALTNKPLFYYGTGSRSQDFTYVKDIANACLKAVESEDYGIYNIASGKPISMRELAFLVKRVVKSDSEIGPANVEDPQEEYRALFNISRANRFLNWYPVYKLEEGIKEFSEHIKIAEILCL